jgi:hypothetical protein
LQGAEKVAVEKTASIFAKNVGSKTLKAEAITIFEQLGVRAGAVLTVPYLGEVLLAIDVITTLWAVYEESRKDNVYQIWIRLAGLANVK